MDGSSDNRAQPAVGRNILQIDHLTVEYRPSREAPHRPLQDLGLVLHQGEAVGLLGPSGGGKTSLALALLGMLPAAAHVLSGAMTLHLEGASPRRLPLHRKAALAPLRGRHIGMAYQEPKPALHPMLTIRDQVAEVIAAHDASRALSGAGPRRPWWKNARASALSAADQWLREVGLDDALGHAFPHQLSGGQQQRAVVAQALAGGAAILLADEPTAALDPLSRRGIVQLFADLRRRRSLTILWISHDRQLLTRHTDRILSLRDGRLHGPEPTVPGAADGGGREPEWA